MVELVERVQRRERTGVFTGKAREVEDHAARERVEDRADGVTIRGRQRANASDRVAHALEQPALGRERLEGSGGARDRAHVGRRSTEGGAQGLQVSQALAARDEPRVGHGVGGARQQIRETEGLADAAGKNSQ